MENNSEQIRVSQGVRAIVPDERGGREPSHQETPYWGVLCRTCRQVVAFDCSPYVSFGPTAASMKPGAIRCGQGHTHIYFPRDFQFCASAVPIPDTVMQKNRELFHAIHSTGERSSHDTVLERVKPEPVSEISQGRPEIQKTRPVLARDPRREAAQMAAKARWANWAGLKVR